MHAELAATGAQVLTLIMPDMARVAPLAVVLRRRLQFLNSVTLECRQRYGSTPTGCTPTAKGTVVSPPRWPSPSGARRRTGGRSRRLGQNRAVCASPLPRPPGPGRTCSPGPGSMRAGSPQGAPSPASGRTCCPRPNWRLTPDRRPSGTRISASPPRERRRQRRTRTFLNRPESLIVRYVRLVRPHQCGRRPRSDRLGEDQRELAHHGRIGPISPAGTCRER